MKSEEKTRVKQLDAANTVCTMLQKQNLEMAKNPAVQKLKQEIKTRQQRTQKLVATIGQKNEEHMEEMAQFKDILKTTEGEGKRLYDQNAEMLEKHKSITKIAEMGHAQIAELKGANEMVWKQIDQ